jgi:hypothetical protein
MVIYPEDAFDDDDDGLEFRKIERQMHKKPTLAMLNKKGLTPEDMDRLFLGE